MNSNICPNSISCLTTCELVSFIFPLFRLPGFIAAVWVAKALSLPWKARVFGIVRFNLGRYCLAPRPHMRETRRNPVKSPQIFLTLTTSLEARIVLRMAARLFSVARNSQRFSARAGGLVLLRKRLGCIYWQTGDLLCDAGRLFRRY